MKVMINSIPKGGTHLLLKLVYLLGIKDDPKRFWLGAGVINRGLPIVNKALKGGMDSQQIVIGCETPVTVGKRWLMKKVKAVPDQHSFGAHCNYSPGLAAVMQENNVKLACIIRDPRSIAVSHLHYVKSWEKHFFHKEYMALPSDHDRLTLSINGGKIGKFQLSSLAERYTNFMGWKADPNTAFVKFEHLVGPGGGGEMAEQIRAIELMADHLGISISREKTHDIAQNVFGKKSQETQSDTFRKGHKDSWREELDPDLIALLNSELSDTLKALDYPAE